MMTTCKPVLQKYSSSSPLLHVKFFFKCDQIKRGLFPYYKNETEDVDVHSYNSITWKAGAGGSM